MKNMLRLGLYVCAFGAAWAGASSNMPLLHAPIQPENQASLQRGWKIYQQSCAGCHSLRYTRYQQIARDLGVVDAQGQVMERFLKEEMLVGQDSLAEPVVARLDPADAEAWFGVAPPDLTLVTRARGVDWVYTFLKSFYQDDSRPFGVNNRLFPSVGMPHVLEAEQGGLAQAQWAESHHQVGQEDHVSRVVVALSTPDEEKAEDFEKTVTDLVNFLHYIGEPAKRQRTRIGTFVLLFLGGLTALVYLVKREYWKDIA